MNTEFIVQGLTGHNQAEELYKRKIEELFEESPSDSIATSILRTVNSTYEGVIQIVSSQGRFMAQAVHENLNDLARLLSQQIEKQLREWRGYRFLAEKN